MNSSEESRSEESRSEESRSEGSRSEGSRSEGSRNSDNKQDSDTSQLRAPKPVLIAHRGYSGRYPENSLIAYQAAEQHGAKYMELDLQLTADRVPVLHHDASLLRMSGEDVDVRDITAKAFKSKTCSYPSRFQDQFNDNRFTTFRKYCKWLAKNESITTFVEIKQESIDRFGIPVFMDEVYRRILKADVEAQCVIISFNPEVIEYTRHISSMQTGWVLPEWNDDVKQRAMSLSPDYLFSWVDILPSSNEEVWQGSWLWALYNLDTVDDAIEMANRGFQFLETNEIGTLMADSQLA